MYSSYKHHNTFKGLVGICPTGAVTFISELYAGSLSDQALTRDCGILELIEPGDSIMADKGFDIGYDVALRGAKLNIPPFLKNQQQLSKKNVITTRPLEFMLKELLAASSSIIFYRMSYQ